MLLIAGSVLTRMIQLVFNWEVVRCLACACFLFPRPVSPHPSPLSLFTCRAAYYIFQEVNASVNHCIRSSRSILRTDRSVAMMLFNPHVLTEPNDANNLTETRFASAFFFLFLSFFLFPFLSFPLSFVFCVCEVRRVWLFACMGLARFFFHFLLSPFNWAVEKLWLWLECWFAPKTALLLTTRSCLQETPTCGDFSFFRSFFFSFLLSFVQNTSGAVMMSTSQAVSEPKWRKLVQNWKGPPAAAPSLLIPLF